jgi:L-arabinokinase
VLLSFGGLGLERLPWKTLQRLRDYYFVGTDNRTQRGGNIFVLPQMQREYCDLMRAADVIIAKPGYGIVADILAHQTPVLYVERNDFPEVPYLAQALNELTTAEFLPLDDLLSGSIEPQLVRLLKHDRHWPAVALNGAEIAAEKIIALAVAASS